MCSQTSCRHVDGHDYMWAVSELLEKAQEAIFIMVRSSLPLLSVNVRMVVPLSASSRSMTRHPTPIKPSELSASTLSHSALEQKSVARLARGAGDTERPKKVTCPPPRRQMWRTSPALHPGYRDPRFFAREEDPTSHVAPHLMHIFTLRAWLCTSERLMQVEHALCPFEV